MLSPPTAKNCLDAVRQLVGGARPKLGGEGGGDVVDAAGREHGTRHDAVGCRILAADAQQLVRQAQVTTGSEQRHLAVDRHPGQPIVDKGAVLVE